MLVSVSSAKMALLSVPVGGHHPFPGEYPHRVGYISWGSAIPDHCGKFCSVV